MSIKKPSNQDLHKSLMEIQQELKAPKDLYNSFGKYSYRSCEGILESVKPLLKEKGCTLTLTDEVKEAGNVIYVEAKATIRMEEEEISVTAQAGIDINKKGMDTSQTFGASSSYARKYALNGLFLIDDTKDADATNDHGKGKAKSDPKVSAAVDKAKNKPWLNDKDEAWDKAVEAIKKGEVTLEQVKKKYNISKANQEKLEQLSK